MPRAKIPASPAVLLVPLASAGCLVCLPLLAKTGFVFGNPEFFRYNVEATLQPLRILLALLVRLWQTAGYFHLLMLTLAALFAMWLPPLRDQDGERPRIALDAQFAMLAVVVAYVLAMAMVGGAELARYMLPVVPLVILVCVSTLWRRVRLWRGVAAIVALMFVAGWFINPPYGFAPEDNLAYRGLHPFAPACRTISGGALSHGAGAYRLAGQRRIDASVSGLCHAPHARGAH